MQRNPRSKGTSRETRLGTDRLSSVDWIPAKEGLPSSVVAWTVALGVFVASAKGGILMLKTV